jgi:foldase protein PrsA
MRRLSLLFLAVPLALVAAACGGGGGGGGGSLSSGDVAVVAGTHITRAELDRRMQQARCSYELQKQDFPKAGSPGYQSIQSQILQNLVQGEELAQKGRELGVSVSDQKLADQLQRLKKQYFGGSETRYRSELKRQCTTDAEVRRDVRASLLSDEIYKKVTAEVKVTDGQALAYYNENPQTYTQPQTRVVRHILVKNKDLADRLYTQVTNGGDFAALAKQHSQDPGSKAQGGRLTITKGQTVPEFDKTAFGLDTGAISKPVKTQFGWHIIEALKDTSPSKTTPFAQVRQAIRQQLLQERRSEAVQAWLQGVQ